MSVSARRSQESSPRPGTTLNASPACSTVGTAVRCAGPSGAWQAATACAAAASASSALRPRSGAEPECAERPRAWTLTVPAALRRTTTPSPPSAVSSPASKHRHASQPAKRSACTNGPARHSSSQTSSSATSAKSARRPTSARSAPSASTTPPFMSTAPEPTQPLAVAPQRLVVRVRDDRVDVPEQQDPARAAPAQRREQVGRVRGARARRPLDLGLGRQQRRAHRRALLGAVHVARRRRDRDERLELARRALRDQPPPPAPPTDPPRPL